MDTKKGRKWQRQTYVMGDTIEEKPGREPAFLKETTVEIRGDVDRYNELAEKGDEDFI